MIASLNRKDVGENAMYKPASQYVPEPSAESKMTSHVTVKNVCKIIGDLNNKADERVEILEKENERLRQELAIVLQYLDREHDC